jgi:hypothetical protein
MLTQSYSPPFLAAKETNKNLNTRCKTAQDNRCLLYARSFLLICCDRMKTERKYPEPNRIVFCILFDQIRIFVSDFTVFAFVFIFQM